MAFAETESVAGIIQVHYVIIRYRYLTYILSSYFATIKLDVDWKFISCNKGADVANMKFTLVLLVAAILCVSSSFALDISAADVAAAKAKLQKILGGNIPDELQKWVAILEKNIGLLQCLPKNKGNSLLI